MKKLIVMLACGLGVVAANAAVVSWGSGSAMKPDGSAYSAAGDIKMYVFELAASDYEGLTEDDIVKMDVSMAAVSGATTKSSTGITLNDSATYKPGDTVYAAILLTAKGADGNDYYIAQKMTAGPVDEMDSNITFSSLSKKNYMTGAAVTWTQGGGDVPEPTSGLLLLLGVAGLALRRKAK